MSSNESPPPVHKPTKTCIGSFLCSQSLKMRPIICARLELYRVMRSVVISRRKWTMLFLISLLKMWWFSVAESEMRKRGKQVYWGDLCFVYTLLWLSLPSLKLVRSLTVTVPIRITGGGGDFYSSWCMALSWGILSLLVWKSPESGVFPKFFWWF